jgi:hypothetical protein
MKYKHGLFQLQNVEINIPLIGLQNYFGSPKLYLRPKWKVLKLKEDFNRKNKSSHDKTMNLLHSFI